MSTVCVEATLDSTPVAAPRGAAPERRRGATPPQGGRSRGWFLRSGVPQVLFVGRAVVVGPARRCSSVQWRAAALDARRASGLVVVARRGASGMGSGVAQVPGVEGARGAAPAAGVARARAGARARGRRS